MASEALSRPYDGIRMEGITGLFCKGKLSHRAAQGILTILNCLSLPWIQALHKAVPTRHVTAPVN